MRNKEDNIKILSKRGCLLDPPSSGPRQSEDASGLREECLSFPDRPSTGFPWVLRVSLEHWDKTFFNTRFGLDNSFIAYVQDGRMTVLEGPREIEAGPGEIMYLAQSELPQQMSVASESGLHLVILSVLREGEGNDIVSTFLGDVSRSLPLGDSGCVESLLFCMLEAAEKGHSSSSDIVSSLLAPTLRTIKRENENAAEVVDPRQRAFNQCRRYIFHNYLSLQSVSAVAERFGIRHALMCHLFKKHEGCSPHHFLLKRKMTHALHDLQQRSRTITEIADQLGFADRYSFSKTFKRVMGRSPSQARSSTRG